MGVWCLHLSDQNGGCQPSPTGTLDTGETGVIVTPPIPHRRQQPVGMPTLPLFTGSQGTGCGDQK